MSRIETLPPGTILDDRYEIVDRIAQGGFAAIYGARHVHLDRRVAIKLLDVSRDGLDTADFRRRFLAEAQIAAELEHPNVVRIYDFGFTGAARQPYIAMERLDGHDLRRALRRSGPMQPTRAVRLVCRCLDALGMGHELGVVHKDLKPNNLFLTHPLTEAENLVVLDFGVARSGADRDSVVNSDGEFLGTPRYSAPEMIIDQRAGPPTDVYQMALILVEMLTGRPVVAAKKPMDCLVAHCQGALDVPQSLHDGPLGPVLQRALAGDPAERFPDGHAFRDALERAARRLSGSFVVVPSESSAGREIDPERSYDECFDSALRDYLGGDLLSALVGFRECLQRRPHDDRAAYNLDVLERRLEAD